MSIDNSFKTLRYLSNWFSGIEKPHSNAFPLSNMEYSNESLSGWKTAYLSNIDTLFFKGLSFGKYGVDSDYSCFRKGCIFGSCGRCGFYSFKDFDKARDLAEKRFGTVVLKVSHFGTVVIHSEGYRSQSQIVDEILVSPICANFFCNNQTIGMRVNKDYYVTACSRHIGEGVSLKDISKQSFLRVVTL